MSIDQRVNDSVHADYLNQKSEPKIDFNFRKELDKLIAMYLYSTNNTGKSRNQISTKLSVPRSSVYDSLIRMMISGLIECDYTIGYKNSLKKGRPTTVYYLKHTKQGNKR